MALPYNGSALAGSPEREALARRAGELILELVARQITPRQIVTPEALDDAFALDMAMGGSTNTVLHALAIAHEGGMTYALERINGSRRACHTYAKSARLAHGTWRMCIGLAASRPS